MISTKFKRFIAVLLCVVVLASFSLSAFASYSTLAYENINSIQESFVASFLSHCGIEVEFFNWDLDYSGSEFKNAAWCNLTRNFLNYIVNNDSKMSNEILDYASSCGIDSSIHGSSFVWDGSFKDCREIVNQLIYHLYNYLSSYENVYGFVDVPLSMYIGDDEEKYTGCYSRVDFSEAISLSDWYTNIGQSIQSYCTGDYVEDGFAECYFNYVWDYSKLPLGYNTYIETLESYIDDYDTSSGDSSGGSSDSSDTSSGDSSDTSSGGNSSNDPIEFPTEVISFSKVYYRSFFLSLLSTFNIDFYVYYSNDSASVQPSPYQVESRLTPLVDYLYKLVMGDVSSSYIEAYYPDMKQDFLSICANEIDTGNFGNLVYSVYPFSEDISYRRFILGFYELFNFHILDSSFFHDSDSHSTYKHFFIDDKIIYLVFPDDYVDYRIDYIEYLICSYTTIHPIPVHSDLSFYWEDGFLDGYDFCHQYSDIFSFDSQELFDFGNFNIRHLTHTVVYLNKVSSFSVLSYITTFINNLSGVTGFIVQSVEVLPSGLVYCFYGGFLLIFVFTVFRLII